MSLKYKWLIIAVFLPYLSLPESNITNTSRRIQISNILMRYAISASTHYLFSFGFKPSRLCGLVVRVLGYRSGGPDSIPGTTRKKK
jgi:hypothetical protein